MIENLNIPTDPFALKNCHNIGINHGVCKYSWWSTDHEIRCTHCNVDVPKYPPTKHGNGRYKSLFPEKCPYHYLNARQFTQEEINDMEAKKTERKYEAALSQIADILSGSEWNADSAEGIAEIVRNAGFEIKDIDEDTENTEEGE